MSNAQHTLEHIEPETDGYEEEPTFDPEIAGNPSIANDHLRRLGRHYKAMAELEALRDTEIEKIKLWFERASEPIIKDIVHAEQSLQYYFINAPDDHKTIDLPNGRFARRNVAAKLKVEDKNVAIKWAQEEGLDNILDYKPTIIKKELDAHFKASGEIPEGCEVEAAHERYEYKPTNPVDLVGDPA